MIIIEGPDGGGKTTLVNHLAEKYKIPVNEKIVGSDTKPLVNDLQHWAEMNLKAGLQWKIFDRHCMISESIYQGAMRRAPKPGFDNLAWYTSRMLDLTRIQPYIIYCLPSYDRVYNNVVGDGANAEVSPYLQEIYYSYVAKAAGDIARGQAIHYDYNHGFERVELLFEMWQRGNRARFAREAKVYF